MEYTSLLRYIVTGQTILHYCTRKINNFARQLAIVVERIVSGKAVRQQANTIVPMINWVAGAAAGEVLCLHYKDGDGDFGLNMKSLFIAEVSFVLNTNNTTHFSHRIYNFVYIISDARLRSLLSGSPCEPWACMGPGPDWASASATCWWSSASWFRSPPGSHPPPPTGELIFIVQQQHNKTVK